ncbi:NAD(P)-binding protein [Nadsonia fulvescens var. elongata DSM 6958]|uniref:Probable quinone oxidoreductase n=1 Tax=Nadsonia fulvescens var. elongata DSM 6958 TaxID=857566 RepID=A0A1E3PMT2_9ASCO|nr:NAD(P)-binding protein [Nadsonia fulvescens var. elongata DSM 6958]
MSTTTPIPSTMKAVRMHENGGPDVIKYEEISTPILSSPSQILVAVKYSGINFIESYFRSGLYPTQQPYTFGREATGEVVAVGDDAAVKFQIGDKVAFLEPGAFAEYMVLDTTANHRIFKLPAKVDLKSIAGALLQGLTAYTFIHEAYEVKAGDDILITAPAGGVGSLFVQLCKLRHANVIGVTSTASKVELAKQLGCDHVIVSSDEDVASRVLEITNNKGVEGAFDGVGKDSFEFTFKSMARKGTFVSYGNASGPVPPLNLLTLSAKNMKIARPTLFGYVATPDEFNKYTGELVDLITQGKLKVNISQTYPLKDYKYATIALESKESTGKLVLEI